MEQKHPVIQMALSFRDYPSLQTPVMSQQPCFHEKMLPHRVRVLGEGQCAMGRSHLSSPLSGAEVAAGIVVPPQPRGQTSHTLSSQPSYFSLPSSSTCSFASPSILFPGHRQPWWEIKVKPRPSSQSTWARIVPIGHEAVRELSAVLPRL